MDWMENSMTSVASNSDFRASSSPQSEVDAFRFNTLLRRLKTPVECADLFREAISPYGFDTFACGELDLNNRERHVFYIIDWTERWRQFYLQSGLINRDPVVEALAVRQDAYTWSDLRRDRKWAAIGAAALDGLAAEGWVDGLVVPLPRGDGRTGLVAMAGHENECSLLVKSFLCLISVCLHSHVRTLVAREGFAVPPMGLTAREIECVRLVARGHADKAIAQAIGVLPSTAHEFVEKAKRRLHAKSRAEMVAVAVSLGMIDV
jgi:DNA-binding CsgD family transcriptional regulator